MMGFFLYQAVVCVCVCVFLWLTLSSLSCVFRSCPTD